MATASKILVTEGDAPTTPSAGTLVIYARADSKFYKKNSAGVESEMAGTSGTSGTSSTSAGPAGTSGTSGSSGVAGTSGTSGTGVSGTSGSSGTSGTGGGAGGASVTRATFTNASLTAGVLTITHNLGLSAPYTVAVWIFDNNSKQIIPGEITGLTNTCTVDLSAYGTLTGTWGYGVLAG